MFALYELNQLAKKIRRRYFRGTLCCTYMSNVVVHICVEIMSLKDPIKVFDCNKHKTWYTNANTDTAIIMQTLLTATYINPILIAYEGGHRKVQLIISNSVSKQ